MQLHRLAPVRLQPQPQVDIVIAIEELQQRINDNVLEHVMLNGQLVDQTDEIQWVYYSLLNE
jgi:hypothetical protein